MMQMEVYLEIYENNMWVAAGIWRKNLDTYYQPRPIYPPNEAEYRPCLYGMFNPEFASARPKEVAPVPTVPGIPERASLEVKAQETRPNPPRFISWATVEEIAAVPWDKVVSRSLTLTPSGKQWFDIFAIALPDEHTTLDDPGACPCVQELTPHELWGETWCDVTLPVIESCKAGRVIFMFSEDP